MENKEVLAQRIVSIIIKLNSGESVEVNQLAQEFGVSERTIQRDLYQRLAFLPIVNEGKKITLLPAALGKYTSLDVRNFASLVGTQQLFPNLDNQFITRLLSNKNQPIYSVIGGTYECERELIKQNCEKLERAIKLHKKVSFTYKDKDYNDIEPYQLINHNQVWYLAANDSTKIKTFHLTKLQKIVITGAEFEFDKNKLNQILASKSIFINDKPKTAKLKVKKEIAEFFTRRELLPNQKLIEELENGDLVFESQYNVGIQLTSIVKHWLPSIEIIQPVSLKEELLKELKMYLKQTI